MDILNAHCKLWCSTTHGLSGDMRCMISLPSTALDFCESSLLEFKASKLDSEKEKNIYIYTLLASHRTWTEQS